MSILIKLCMIFPGRVGTGQGVGKKTMIGMRNCSVEVGYFYERKMKIYRNSWPLPVSTLIKLCMIYLGRVGTGQGCGEEDYNEFEKLVCGSCTLMREQNEKMEVLKP